MSETEGRPPKVFISYSHDSDEHADNVLALAERLRREGVDAVLDQWEPFPEQGWILWMNQNLNSSNFVLMVFTPAYRRRIDDEEEEGKGHGVRWEGRLIRTSLYEDGNAGKKYMPVFFDPANEALVPREMRDYPRFHLGREEGYLALYRHLTGQPGLVKPDIGSVVALPEKKVYRDFEPTHFHIPYPKNAFFTGRTKELDALREAFLAGTTNAVTQVLSGLGGMGKTQAAVEYAYRHRQDYRAIFWSRAAGQSELMTDFAVIAKHLDLPEKDAQNPEDTRDAVKEWLASNSGWLLILDDAENPNDLKPFIPATHTGHVLITSRGQDFRAVGVAAPMFLGRLEKSDGLKFLMRSTGCDESDPAESEAAAQLSEELGGLPLALEQAAAYISENGTQFQAYLRSFKKRRLTLLNSTDPVAGDYKHSVATAWELNFEKILTKSKAAGELLRFSAFLSSDRIPLELLVKGAEHLGPVLSMELEDAEEDELVLDDVISPLAKYSLVYRDRKQNTFDVHRLVQEVMRSGMEDDAKRQWAERAVKTVSAIFPPADFANWPACERLLPHAVVCADHIKTHEFVTEPAVKLLIQAGDYLQDRAQYAQAEPILQRAIELRTQLSGADHAETGKCINLLAILYFWQGRYADAEREFLRVLSIWEKAYGPDHSETAKCLNNLAALYNAQGRSQESEELHRRALAIAERNGGDNQISVAWSLVNLAILCYDQGRLDEARPLYERALRVQETVLGTSHPDVASTLNNLGMIDRDEGTLDLAEAGFRRALEITEKALGEDHPNTANCLGNLGSVFRLKGLLKEAETYYRRAYLVQMKCVGADHPDTAESLNDLAAVYEMEERYVEAAALLKQALAAREQSLGPEHSDTVETLSNLARIYAKQGKGTDALPLLERVVTIMEAAHGSESEQAKKAKEESESVMKLAAESAAKATAAETPVEAVVLERSEEPATVA